MATATAIVPRWEWRVFGEQLGAAEEHLSALTPDRAAESDELYVLCAGREASIKVRDDKLDVKRLEQVDADGLQQWRPVAKADYPLSAEQVGILLTGLGATAPALRRDTYTVEQLVEEVVRPSPELVAIAVHKRRMHYIVDGCMAELSEIRTDRGTRQTIGVESEDPALVLATARQLGLDMTRNVSLPRELKLLAGFDAHRYAAVDVGTNSVKLHVGELLADGTWQAIDDRAIVTRLGEGLAETGALGAEPVARTADAVAELTREARLNGAEQVAAVGTAGLRIAPNAAALVDAVRGRSGIEVEVISGEEEARLAYKAAIAGLGAGTGTIAVFDTGGGSSQFTLGEGARVDERFSVNVGAARFTERFGLAGVVGDDTLADAQGAIAAELSALDGRPAPQLVVGMGGAVTNLTAVMLGMATYDPDAVQGSQLELAEIDRQIDLYRTSSAEQRRRIVGLQPSRAEVILAGACIVRAVLAKLGAEALTVSDRGLRHGLLADRFSPGVR